MKMWIVFTLLKSIELGALVFVPYWVGNNNFPFYSDHNENNIFIIWFRGLTLIIILSVVPTLTILFIVQFLPWFFELNMEWANRIIGG